MNEFMDLDEGLLASSVSIGVPARVCSGSISLLVCKPEHWPPTNTLFFFRKDRSKIPKQTFKVEESSKLNLQVSRAHKPRIIGQISLVQKLASKEPLTDGVAVELI